MTTHTYTIVVIVVIFPFAGISLTYILFQLAIWWLFHTSALLWKVGLPLHARSFQKSGKTKYIHIACVIVGVVSPLVSVIALMANYGVETDSAAVFATGGLGFGMDRFPPLLCSGGDSAVFYYSNILPINLIFFVGITELILLFAIVHKVRKFSAYSSVEEPQYNGTHHSYFQYIKLFGILNTLLSQGSCYTI